MCVCRAKISTVRACRYESNGEILIDRKKELNEWWSRMIWMILTQKCILSAIPSNKCIGLPLTLSRRSRQFCYLNSMLKANVLQENLFLSDLLLHPSILSFIPSPWKWFISKIYRNIFRKTGDANTCCSRNQHLIRFYLFDSENTKKGEGHTQKVFRLHFGRNMTTIFWK